MFREQGKTADGERYTENDTIAAISTAVGQAGIGIIRISGPLSLQIALKLFKPKRSVKELQTHHLYLGHLCDPKTGVPIDEVLLSYMKAPSSYTREDVVEINSHSGYLLLSKILGLVIAQGARLARPGEFTLRAFLNGRIDLTQGEAVIDLINSQSERGLHMASRQIAGSFREEIRELRQSAVDILGNIEVAIDFPEEEAAIMSRKDAADSIMNRLVRPVEELLKNHESRRMWVDGINTVIVGRVNAGKSSLLNRILDEERAIVAPLPGTTRDIIDSTVSIEGIPLRLMDTAGLREAARDEVERIGVRLTSQKLDEADFLLVVIDQSRRLNQDDMRIMDQCKGKRCLVVINKIDLAPMLTHDEQERVFAGFPIARISALTGEGLDELKKRMVDCLLESDLDMTSSHVVPNMRHREALEGAAHFFRDAAESVREEKPMEIAAFELKSGLDALGEVTGETAGEDVLDSIFSRFCLGK